MSDRDSALEKAFAFVRDRCPHFPTFGLGGGSGMEARAQDAWIAKYGGRPLDVLRSALSAEDLRYLAGVPASTRQPDKALANEALAALVARGIEPPEGEGGTLEWSVVLGESGDAHPFATALECLDALIAHVDRTAVVPALPPTSDSPTTLADRHTRIKRVGDGNPSWLASCLLCGENESFGFYPNRNDQGVKAAQEWASAHRCGASLPPAPDPTKDQVG